MSAGNEREFIDFQQSKEKGGITMKCPLLTAGNIERFPPENEEFLDCLKEECAWWDIDVGRCSMATAKVVLTSIALRLNEIASKMPHEEQFRR